MSEQKKKPSDYRGVNDEIHEQHLKLKDMPLKEKLRYFWDYYRIHAFVVLLVIVLGITLVHDVTSAKEYNFYGIMLNSFFLSGEKMESAFAEYADLDTNEYNCYIDTDSALSYAKMEELDMATVQRLMALIQTKDLDALIFDSVVFNNYANNEFFLDLNTVFSEEELKQYEGYIYYVDYSEIQASNEDMDYVNKNQISPEAAKAMTLEDIKNEAEKHRHPEDMEQPVPVGIFLDESPFARKTGSYGQTVPVFGFATTTTRVDTCKKYLEFLLDESVDFSAMLEE